MSFSLAILVLCAASASATTRNVPSQYSTVQAAINAAASGDTIRIASGTYSGASTVPSGKNNLTIIGAGKTSTILTTGAGSIALTISGQSTLVKNLTLRNTAGVNGGQNPACRTNGKYCSFNNVKITGYQDTFAVWNNSIVYCNDYCEIEGSVDFIYSGGTAFFEGCKIRQLRATGGPCSAPSTPTSVRGLIFWKCSFEKASGVANASTTLSRVWVTGGEAAFINCGFGAHIKPVGYQSWNEGTTSRIAEYPCPSTRASWCKRLTSTSGYTKSSILGSWSPRL